jgi:hypothetical protein
LQPGRRKLNMNAKCQGNISALSGGDDFEMLQVILAVKEIRQQ